MSIAGRLRPLERRRARWFLPPACHAAAAVLAAVMLASPSGSAAPRTAGDPSDTHAGAWEFVPLGPEGADFVSVTPLDREFWLGQSARGQLFCWIPYDSTTSGGAWERVPLGRDGLVHQVWRIESDGEGARVFVLLTDGVLHTWQPPSADTSSELPKARWGALRRWAALPAERALSVVSALAGAGTPSAPDLLLALRDGTFYGFRPDGRAERWPARFLDPEARQDPRPSEGPPRTRIRWAGRHPGDPAVILAITEWEGLFISRDGARSFSPVTDGLPKGVRSIAALPGGGLCAACAEGVFVCHELGASWQLVRGQCGGSEVDCREISALLADPRASEHLLARTPRGRILRSRDGGETWSVVLGEIPVRVRSMAHGLGGDELLLATSRGVLASDDGGTSWQWRNRGLRQVAVQTIAVSRDGNDGEDLFVGTDLGFYALAGGSGRWRADLGCAPEENGLDPLTWQRLSGRVFALDLWEGPAGYRLLCLGTEAGPAVGGWDPLGVGCGWTAGGPLQPTTAILTLDSGDVWAAGRTAEGFWAARREPTGDWASVEMPAAAGTVLDPSGPPPTLVHWAGAGGDRILMASGGLTSLGAAQEGVDPDGAAGATGGAARRGSVPGPPRCSVLFTAHGHGTLWVSTDDGLWRTRDGARWERVAFKGERTGKVALAGARPGLVVCRTSEGVLLSGDDGASWQAIPVPEQLHVLGLAIDERGSRLYLGTQMGLFAVAVPTLHEPAAGDPAFEEFRPLDAQPNPFSTQVVLRGLLGPAPAGLAPRSERGAGALGAGAAGAATDLAGSAAGNLGPASPSLAGGEDCELLIVNVHGQIVRRIAPRGMSDGAGGGRYAEWSWDGRDERGQAAPKGIYLVSARVGSIGYRGKVIKLR